MQDSRALPRTAVQLGLGLGQTGKDGAAYSGLRNPASLSHKACRPPGIL